MKDLRLVRLIVSGCGMVLILSAIAWFAEPSAVFAQKETGTLQVDPQVDRTDPNPNASLSKKVVMVSVLKDGKVVKQKETGMSDVPVNFTLPVGVYDVRVEGDEVAAVTKRGIHITVGDATNVLPAMRSGTGVCDCKYSK